MDVYISMVLPRCYQWHLSLPIAVEISSSNDSESWQSGLLQSIDTRPHVPKRELAFTEETRRKGRITF
jgi:hypothetical protein